jgi:hypothetical protein
MTVRRGNREKSQSRLPFLASCVSVLPGVRPASHNSHAGVSRTKPGSTKRPPQAGGFVLACTTK